MANNRIVFWATLIFGVTLGHAYGQSRTVERFYDHNGNPRGRITQEGDRQVNRDQNGNPHGYSRVEGNRTVYYDNNGNRRGSSSDGR